MLERVTQDIQTAMKAKEKEKVDALRYLKSMLIENKTAKGPLPEIDVVVNLRKKLKDSMEAYPAGSEAVAKIQREMEFLTPYLPSQMSEGEIKSLISQIISQLEGPNMGAVMKQLSPQIKGRFDGKLANQFVKEALESRS